MITDVVFNGAFAEDGRRLEDRGIELQGTFGVVCESRSRWRGLLHERARRQPRRVRAWPDPGENPMKSPYFRVVSWVMVVWRSS